MENKEKRSSSTDSHNTFCSSDERNEMHTPYSPIYQIVPNQFPAEMAEQIQNQTYNFKQNSNSEENIEIPKENINEGYRKKKKKPQFKMNLVIILNLFKSKKKKKIE